MLIIYFSTNFIFISLDTETELKMSKMEVQMVTTEMASLKDNMWKLTGRVQLMEKFIQKQFGDVFWDFVQDHHTDSGDGEYCEESRSPTPSFAPAVTVTLINSNSSIPSSNTSESSSSNNGVASTPPPPPPLIPASKLGALISGGGSGLANSHSGGRPGPRNFLPKSLSSSNTPGIKPKPVLKAASLTTSDSQGAPKFILQTEDRKPVIRQLVRGGESILKSSLKAPSVASSSNRVRQLPAALRLGSTPPTKSLSLKRAVPIDFAMDREDQEVDDKRMINTIENLIGYNLSTNRSVSIIRTIEGIKAETDGYSAAHNGFVREMRPNPCHTRCQNRCHDIWTEGDRMDVFQAYWSIPNEEDRRQWVAERIERVDMATKKTEYSNFRTCTFKYYFPHPENSRVQVCKNFFLATIDEKRSYVEKIAQEVKGISEHYSVSDIPFRRKNQVKGSNGNGDHQDYKHYDGYEVVGWMTGGSMDSQDQDEEYIIGENEEGDDGMEMEETMS